MSDDVAFDVDAACDAALFYQELEFEKARIKAMTLPFAALGGGQPETEEEWV